MYKAIQDTRRKGITCSQNVPHFNRKAWYIDLSGAVATFSKMDGRAIRATFLHEYTRPQREQRLYGSVHVAADSRI